MHEVNSLEIEKVKWGINLVNISHTALCVLVCLVKASYGVGVIWWWFTASSDVLLTDGQVAGNGAFKLVVCLKQVNIYVKIVSLKQSSSELTQLQHGFTNDRDLACALLRWSVSLRRILWIKATLVPVWHSFCVFFFHRIFGHLIGVKSQLEREFEYFISN